jgi:flagellar biosynthesis protein
MSSKQKDLMAVAIEYGHHDVPNITAFGKNKLAEEIIEAAKRAGVMVHKDEDLVSLLSLLEINQEIPESLYRAVAEVLVYSYWLRGMRPGDEKKSPDKI